MVWAEQRIKELELALALAEGDVAFASARIKELEAERDEARSDVGRLRGLYDDAMPRLAAAEQYRIEGVAYLVARAERAERVVEMARKARADGDFFVRVSKGYRTKNESWADVDAALAAYDAAIRTAGVGRAMDALKRIDDADLQGKPPYVGPEYVTKGGDPE